MSFTYQTSCLPATSELRYPQAHYTDHHQTNQQTELELHRTVWQPHCSEFQQAYHPDSTPENGKN